MSVDNQKRSAFLALRQTMNAYFPLSEETWHAFESLCTFREIEKRTILYLAGEVPTTYAFLCLGLVRCFVCDEKGTEYNKIFFQEGSFPGAMTALLTGKPSLLTFETLENSQVIEINHQAYRQLLFAKEDLKLYQINYLEQNWLLHKDAREIEIVQQDATIRYQRFVESYPDLAKRLTQYQIASHLGITATQLSRIRKKR